MLSGIQRRWLEQAYERVDTAGLTEIVAELVDIPSPTGEEGELARAITRRLRARGIAAEEQAIDPRQSNALAALSGRGGGPSLLLYAPMDTVTSNSESEDLPWAGDMLLPEMRARAVCKDGHVLGLGAHNPKGHAACAIAAVEAIAAAAVPLNGTLHLGLGAGGMPTDARPNMRTGSGHGAGCAWMLEHGLKPDFAVIAKSGWSVSWEEVGLAWYEIRVRGTHTYVGSRHLLPYSNAIRSAAKIVEALEDWFPRWAETNRSGLVAPQGVVSFIEGGWERMPAFTPASCRCRVDLRLSPRTTPEEADFAMANELREISATTGCPIEWERLIAIAGTTTDPNNWIVKTAIEAWESVEGRPHQTAAGMSGATDANILRSFGIPTARIGLPKVTLPETDFQRGMNAVRVSDMLKLTQHLIYISIATCCG